MALFSAPLRLLSRSSAYPEDDYSGNLTAKDVQDGLYKHCTQGSLTDETFHEISKLLKQLDRIENHNPLWEQSPRTYAVLCIMGATEWMPTFAKITTTNDFNLPYDYQTWPPEVKNRELQEKFLQTQEKVVTSAYDLETENGAHQNLSGTADANFASMKLLGKGGYGRVDQVYSRLSGRQYARKSVSRGKASDRKGKYKAIVDELEVIKKLSHRHLVKYIGSYTDKDYIAYLMEPIADCDLYDYLRRKVPDDSRQMNMQDFYGCLAGAINYIHKRHIRHADITSRNILVKSNRVYLSDFGAARDYSITGKSTTQHNVPFNIDYVAPEVVRQEARNSKSDMWSLGVVFLEITTVLRGRKLKSFWRHMEDQAQKTKRPSKSVQANLPAANIWLDKIRSRHSRLEANEPIAWIKTLLEEDQKNRPSSKQLMSHIHSTPSFQHFCCLRCQDDFDKGDFEYENDTEHILPKSRKERFGTDEVRASAEAMLTSTRPVQTPMTEAKRTTIREWMGFTYEGSENPFVISPTQIPATYTRDATGSPPRHGSECPLYTSSTSSEPSDKDYQSIDTDSSDDSSYHSRNDDRGEDSGRGYVIKTDPDSSDDSDIQQEPSSTIRGYHIISESESDFDHSYLGQDQSESFTDYFMSNRSETSESSSVIFHEAEEEFHSDKGVILVDEVVGESETDALPVSTLTATSDATFHESPGGPEMTISLSRESSVFYNLTCMSHMLTRGNESRSTGTDKEIATDPIQESPGKESRGLKQQYAQNYETNGDAESALTIKDLEINAHVSSNRDEVAPGARDNEIQSKDKGPLVTVSVNEDAVVRLHHASTVLVPIPGGASPAITEQPEAQAWTLASTRTEPCSRLTRDSSPLGLEQNSNAIVRIALPAALEETGESVRGLSLLDDMSRPHRTNVHSIYESPREIHDTQPMAVIEARDQIPALYGDKTAIDSPWLGVAYGLQGQPSGNYERAKTAVEEAEETKKANHDIVHDHQPSVEGHEAKPRKQKQPRLRKKEEALHTSQPVLSQAMDTESQDEGAQGDTNMGLEVHPSDSLEAKSDDISRTHNGSTKEKRDKSKTRKVTFERLSAKRSDGKDSDSQNPGVLENEASKSGAQKHSISPKRSRPRRKAQPRLFPEAFMDETRNKSNTPGSVASSTLTERTRDKLKRANLNPNPYIDKTYNLLENFCCQGKYSAVRRLLDAGINPGTFDKKRPSPLLNAVLGASYNHNKCVEYLLRYGANPHIVAIKRYKKTLLQLAIENDASEGSGYIKLINMLVFAGVDPNAHDANGEYTLHKIFKGPDKTGLANHKLEALALLLQSETRDGTNVNIQVSGTLDTPLHLAVTRHSAMAVAMLLKKGANVNAVNSSGSTPLLSTALMWRGELDDEEQQILELLSEHEEVDLNATSGAKKRTALHHAVFAGAVTAVELLLEKGADPRAKDADGKEPIERLQSDRRRASPEDDDIRALIYNACLVPTTVLEEQQAS